MDLSQYISQALALTIENPAFVEMDMSELEFAKLVKESEAICKSIANEHGPEGLEEFCAQLGDKEEWLQAADFFDSLCFDDDD
ncbi:hypothetical protein [Pseudobacteriovorax antillogorgiicola]|uniref:Uncharacterized protein n=1 Tax=Pseudobacteriovorax antillogorgiicola TaxID=1513793 RepID=A0A1Y6CM72_9BACT|nr:hypothetical protein [Pseudobacteriovorax antillogorgiicola]TCS45430.1 hypothetical protein EDD56_12841 [Pseudobacteriovorax antillogorgiicola]SMF74228.1 hypothetical protein SAMN06296036_12841 [Pseudobacteriovorax antillogorgiicola]